MQPRRRKRKPADRQSDQIVEHDVETEILGLGVRGDGIGKTQAGTVFVPFAAPGDRVLLDVTGNQGSIKRILHMGENRSPPSCRHFEACGGCVAQHLSPDICANWKRDLVTGALASHGITSPDVSPVILLPPGDRRRTTFTSVADGGQITVGYNRHASHELIEVSECPLLEPSIIEALPRLESILRLVGQRFKRLSLSVTSTLNGLDVNLVTRDGQVLELSWEEHSALSEAAAQADVARLAVNDEAIVVRRAPLVRLSGVEVALPPGGFLQASSKAELALAELVLKGIGNAKNVADLFSGCGTFTFAIARTAKVRSIDSNPEMIAALNDAASRAAGLKSVQALTRNLFDSPMVADELREFDTVVFDPPRAGAKSQAGLLARSTVKRIVAVSCNPNTFARDIRILCDGGYDLVSVTPVDQFVWSSHIELVGVLTKT